MILADVTRARGRKSAASPSSLALGIGWALPSGRAAPGRAAPRFVARARREGRRRRVRPVDKKSHRILPWAAESRFGDRPPMATSDKRKQSLYFPEQMLKEIQEEAARQDRSLSWIVQKAWKLSRREIMKFPSVNDIEDDTEDDHRGKNE